MASKFLGTFEVTADFINTYVDDEVELEIGDWVLVDVYRWHGCVSSNVQLCSVDYSYRYALDFLGLCIRHDYTYRHEYDYELWHVVDTPDWMPIPDPITSVTSIVLLDHADRGVWDETLVRVCTEDFPVGISVLVTDWGIYVPTDWDALNQPRTLAEVGSAGTVDYIEVDSSRNDWLFRLVPAFLKLA